MSLFHLRLNHLGHIELAFVNARTLRKVLRTVIANGGPGHRTAYLQSESDVQSLRDRLPKAALRELDAGWQINVRMDGWEAAHYYGYEAYRTFERS